MTTEKTVKPRLVSITTRMDYYKTFEIDLNTIWDKYINELEKHHMDSYRNKGEDPEQGRFCEEERSMDDMKDENLRDAAWEYITSGDRVADDFLTHTNYDNEEIMDWNVDGNEEEAEREEDYKWPEF